MGMPGDPFSAFAGSLGGGLGKGLGDAIGGGGGPMVSGGTTDARSGMDGSGWTVSTGRASATGGARNGEPSLPGMGLGLASAGLGGMPPLFLFAVLGLGLVLVMRLSK